MSTKSTRTPSLSNPRVVLGVDPGFRSIGFGIVENEGKSFRYVTSETWTSKGDHPHHELQQKLARLVATHRPDVIFVEKLYFHKNTRSAMRVAQMLGVILSEATRQGLTAHELAPTTVKKRLSGHGQADKEAVSRMISLLLKAPPNLSSHATDALAIAIAGCLETPLIIPLT
ncbi:MAG: crossover junction endodeoxyribonuclease RuvC [Parcubacteria group bacterium]|nr:crossover junction endodeoxyribonuclease RuvC [Parcubacteria group bacterium]